MTNAKQGPAVQFRSAALESQLTQRAEAGERLGAVAKEHLARYFRIMAREVAVCGLTQPEWDALRAATISRKFESATPLCLGTSLWEAFEAGDLSHLGVTWDESRVMDLMRKVDGLTYAQQWAVVDWLEMRRQEQT